MITRRAVAFGLAATSILAMRAEAMQMRPVTDFNWRYAQDTVMGGVSRGQAAVERGVLRLTGTVSTANNGGFIQARTDLPDGVASDTIHLRVRGNGEAYYVFLRSVDRTRPWQSYRAPFQTSAHWSDVSLALTDFAPSRDSMPPQITAAEVRSLGLVAYGRDHEADLEVSHISVE